MRHLYFSNRVFFWALAAVVVLLLVSCGGSETTTPTQASETPIATTVPTTAPLDPIDPIDTAEEEPPTEAATVVSTATEVPVATASVVTTLVVTEGTTASVRAGVTAAPWSDNVSIELGDSTFRFISNGLPSHELPDQFLVPIEGNRPPFDGDEITDEFYVANTADLIVESPVNVEIPLNPVYSDEITLTGLSTIGVMVSGVQLFNDYEDQGREFVALDDNLSLDGAYFIDACNGHPLADGSQYHYHGVPYCITDAVDVAGEHSTIIGVLIDGFPIYGSKDVGGVTLTNADLDECSGHFGATPEFPDGIYHYHLTEDEAPYSIDCFHGVIDYGGNAAADGEAPAERPADGEAPAERPADGEAPAELPADGEAPAERPADGEAPAERPADGAGGPGGGGQTPDFAQAAAALGVSEQALRDALGGPPPDFDAAAANLGLDVAQLQAALDAAS